MVGNIKLSNKLLLAEFLKTVPDEGFRMQGWYCYTDGYGPRVKVDDVGCITAACVAGWGSVMWPDTRDSDNRPDVNLLQEKLGLTDNQERQLFFNYKETRQDKIDLLEKWAAE